MLDDDAPIRRLAEIIFERFQCEFVSVEAGKEAIELYRQSHEAGSPFSVVILDLTVSDGHGGREIIHALREIDPSVCALISTGDSTDPAVENYESLGFKGVVLKPYRLQDLKNGLLKAGITI